jgi:hypothetical protein
MTILDKDKCNRFRRSRKIEKNDNRTYYTYTNPLTKRKLKQCSDKYNEINEHCNTILGMDDNNSKSANKIDDPRKAIVDAWIKNPEYDPRTNKQVDNAKYAELYDMSYDYLLSAGITKHEIKRRLPKNHVLFKTIDILYYQRNVTDFSGIENDLYETVDMFLKESVKPNVKIDALDEIVRTYSNDEHIVIYSMIDVLAFVTARYLIYIQLSCSASYINFHKYVTEIHDCIYDLEVVQYFMRYCKLSNVAKIFMNNADDLIDMHHTAEIIKYKRIHFIIKYVHIKRTLNQSKNAIDTLYKWYEYIYKRFNYLNDPDNAPYYDLLVPIEDPLIGILKKIAEKEGHSNIQEIMNLDTLELKEKQPYESVSHYNEKSRIIQENAGTLALYRELIELGALDLMKRAGMSVRKNANIIRANREFIRRHILYDAIDKVNSHLRCNVNRDGITQEDLDDNEYPLYKLQLMFSLQHTNKDGIVARTDCFYAPAFYNYLVEQITSQYGKSKTVIKHPIIGTPITMKDTEKLMDIMYSIDNAIKDPMQFIDTPPKDEELKLEFDNNTSRGYCIINIVRDSVPMKIKLFQLCIIPNDIKSSEIKDLYDDKNDQDKYKHQNSKTFIKMMEGLFNNGQLLFTYMAPYHDAASGFYVKHQNDIFYLVEKLRTVEGWQELDREDQLYEFHDLYSNIENAFTLPLQSYARPSSR